MRTLWTLLFGLCCACTATSFQRGLRHVNNIGLGLAVGTTACDWAMTRREAMTNWRVYRETNAVLGATPSTHSVDAYMAGAIVGTILLGHVLPDWARPLLYGGVVTAEVQAIAGNVGQEVPVLCGFQGGTVRQVSR